MRHVVVSFAVMALVLISAIVVVGQPPPTPEEKAEMMRKYQELAQPGPEHQKLAELAGNWNYSAKMWMSPAESNPMVTEGKGEAKMVIGGRFLQLNSSGSFMGMTYEGFSMLGFDRRSSQYTTVGFDNMGTYWVSAKGPADKETGLITMVGEDVDATMGFTQKYKFILDIKNKDSYTFSIVFTDSLMSQGTGNFKMMEITYNRAK